MTVLELIGEFFIETFVFEIPGRIYDFLRGRKSKINGYRTQFRRIVKFNTASKQMLLWGVEVNHAKDELGNALRILNESLSTRDFKFERVEGKLIIEPPPHISFYTFHFLIQWVSDAKIKSAGIVRTTRTAYIVYDDINSENLIGQTSRHEKFFITLMEDYSKSQFIRVNNGIKTNDEFDLSLIMNEMRKDLEPAV